jgi:hypothetical protein
MMGKTVRICGNTPLKGQFGRVTQVYGEASLGSWWILERGAGLTSARASPMAETQYEVELHARPKKVKLNKDQVREIEGGRQDDPNGPNPGAPPTPWYAGGRTPAHISQTPMHVGQTPMHISNTPMHDGGRTPMHDGGRTPMHDGRSADRQGVMSSGGLMGLWCARWEDAGHTSSLSMIVHAGSGGCSRFRHAPATRGISGRSIILFSSVQWAISRVEVRRSCLV